VFTASQASPYGSATGKSYPTALLDLDGNERAAIYLRNSELNKIHLLLVQLQRRDMAPELRRAVERACHQAIERYATRSLSRIRRMKLALDAAQPAAQKLEPKGQAGLDGLQTRRNKARAASWSTDERAYREAIAALERLASYRPGRPAVSSELAPKHMIGEPNTIHQLQNYVVSLAPGGLHIDANGDLDESRSFRRVDYFDLLTGYSAELIGSC
jgi:hypothetical protein